MERYEGQGALDKYALGIAYNKLSTKRKIDLPSLAKRCHISAVKEKEVDGKIIQEPKWGLTAEEVLAADQIAKKTIAGINQFDIQWRKDNPDESKEAKNLEYILQDRGWFTRNGTFYLEVIDNTGEEPRYMYAVSGEKVTFVDSLTAKEPKTDNGVIVEPGLKYVPRHLPTNKDGQTIFLVGLPDAQELMEIKKSDITELKTQMIAHIKKYADMSELDTDLSLYYVLMSWFYPKLSTVPYLRYRADMGKGKSRMLDVAGDISFLPVRGSGASSAAGLIRFQEYWHGTLIIDEADLKGEKDDTGGYTNDVIKYLNLGFERNRPIIKADKVDPKQQEVFDPFCPKIIGMRSIFQDNATEGRCLSISPSETERKDIPYILPKHYYDEVKKIRAVMAHYVLTHWEIVGENDPYPTFDDMDVEPRLKQLGAPIAKILDKILPDGIKDFKTYLKRRQVEVKTDRAQSFLGGILNTAYTMAINPDNLSEAVTTKEVADALGIKTYTLTRTIKDAQMDIEVRKVPRVTQTKPDNDGKTKMVTRMVSQKCIVAKSAKEWREVFRRYILMEDDPDKPKLNIPVDDSCPQYLRSNRFVDN
jgi:hypothetical protein